MDATLRGTVHSGRREAAGFLSLPWVVGQLREQLGAVPFPGTLNLRLADDASLAAWEKLRTAGAGSILRSPDPAFCDASCHPVLVAGKVRGAVVLPRVPGYPPDVVEVIAEEGLRERLGLADGDEVVLTFDESRSKRFSCVLFDFEGTLVDFQWRLAEAEAELRRVLSDLGFDLAPFAADNYALLRTRALELAPSDAIRLQLDRRFTAIYDRYDADALSRWSLRPQAPEVLAELRRAGLGLGLVTNIGRLAIGEALARFRLDRTFGAVVTRSDVARAKPAGDGVLKALATLGAAPAEALLVGDSLSDLGAARAAGVAVAILGGGESSAEAVAAARPDWSVPSLADVCALVGAEPA